LETSGTKLVGRGKVGLLFGAHDEATFAEFLQLAGLAKTVANEIIFEMINIEALTVACKVAIPGIEKQTRRKQTGARKQSIHYLYLGREVVDR
jgi:hypothetical protein